MILAIFNAIVYAVFATTPIFIVLRTGAKMQKSARTAVIVLTVIAILGSMLSIARIPLVQYLELGPTFYQRVGKIGLLSVVETGVGTLIICLATLRPLMTLWTEKLGRAMAHLRGQEFHKDNEQRRRYVPRYDMQPTTTYQDMLVDRETLRTIGVLPDCDDEDDLTPRPPKIYPKRSLYMSSISEIMFAEVEHTRRLSTV